MVAALSASCVGVISSFLSLAGGACLTSGSMKSSSSTMRFSTSYSASSSSLVMSMAPRRAPLRARSPAQTARARGLAREAGSRATRPASASPSGPTARVLSMESRIDWVGGRAAGEGAGGARRSSPPRALWPSRAAAAVPRFQPRAHPRIWIGHNSHSLAFQTRGYSPDRPRVFDPMLQPFRLRRSRNSRANPDRPRPHPVLCAPCRQIRSRSARRALAPASSSIQDS